MGECAPLGSGVVKSGESKKLFYLTYTFYTIWNLKQGIGIAVVLQSLSCVQLFATPWTAARQASLSFPISQSLLRLTSVELIMLSNHLILCCSLLLPSIFPSIRVFYCCYNRKIKWPKITIIYIYIYYLSIYICVYMCIYTWKHAYHEYMHMYVYTYIFSNILFSLGWFVKLIWVPIFTSSNSACFPKKNEWLKTFSQRSFYLDKEIKTPFLLTCTEKLRLLESKVLGVEMQGWITPRASDQDEGKKCKWLTMMITQMQ